MLRRESAHEPLLLGEISLEHDADIRTHPLILALSLDLLDVLQVLGLIYDQDGVDLGLDERLLMQVLDEEQVVLHLRVIPEDCIVARVQLPV